MTPLRSLALSSLLALALPLFSDALIEELRGVLLVPSQSDVEKGGAESVDGFHARGMEIPGGDQKMNQELAPEFLGQPLTKEALLDLKRKILQYYRDEGYPVVIVEIPEQDLSSGVLQLVVVESRLGNLKVRGNKWFFDSFYENKFKLAPGEPIHAPTLLNDIAWLNRNPFQNASAVFSPGTSRETTDIDVAVKDAFPFRVYAGGDNTGNSSTHYTRFFTGINWGYAFLLNQILTYQYTSSFNFTSFWAHTLNYTVLFPWKHSLVLYGGLSGVNPEFDDFAGSGHSYQASLRYQIPFTPLYTPFSHELTFGFDFKRTNNNINYVPVENLEVIGSQVNLFQFNLQYSLASSWGKNEVHFMIEGFGSPGHWFPDQSNADYSDLSYGSKNAYIYAKSSLSYLYYLPMDFSLLWFLRGQGSTANLLPSEQMGVGGYDTVRGYDERILNLDNAVVFNFEIKSPQISGFLHEKNYHDQIQFLAFFDYGGGNHVKQVPGMSQWQQIYSVGPGARYQIKNYVSFRCDWGIQLKKAPFSGVDNRVHMGLLVSY